MCRNDPSEAKRDIPLADDAEIEGMVAQFEACRWPNVFWSHRCHLAVGAWYLRRMPFDDALIRVRDSIQRYNRNCGSGAGYHETITQLFLRATRDRLNRTVSNGPLKSIVDELATRSRWPMAWVREHYSNELLDSPAAIAEWVEPDLKPLTL